MSLRKKTTREKRDAIIPLPRGYSNLVPRPRSPWFPHVSDTQAKSLIRNFRWPNWSPMMIRSKRTGIVGIVSRSTTPRLAKMFPRHFCMEVTVLITRDQVRWRFLLIYSLKSNYTLYSYLPYLVLLLLKVPFAHMFGIFWRVLVRRTLFFPTQKSSQPKMGFV